MDNISLEVYENTIVKLITENWRLIKLFQKASSKLDVSEQNRYINQLRYFQKTIENSLQDVEMQIVNLENQIYDPGMAISPMNIDEFAETDTLVVDKVIEPLIMGKDGTIKKEGLVSLRKVEK